MREVNCPCGAATLKISGEPVVQFYCHCGDCRRIHGGAYAPEAMFKARDVEVVGETMSFALKTTPQRCFVPRGAYIAPASRLDGRGTRKRFEESPGSTRIRRRVTPAGSNSRDSATENRPPRKR